MKSPNQRVNPMIKSTNIPSTNIINSSNAETKKVFNDGSNSFRANNSSKIKLSSGLTSSSSNLQQQFNVNQENSAKIYTNTKLQIINNKGNDSQLMVNKQKSSSKLSSTEYKNTDSGIRPSTAMLNNDHLKGTPIHHHLRDRSDNFNQLINSNYMDNFNKNYPTYTTKTPYYLMNSKQQQNISNTPNIHSNKLVDKKYTGQNWYQNIVSSEINPLSQSSTLRPSSSLKRSDSKNPSSSSIQREYSYSQKLNQYKSDGPLTTSNRATPLLQDGYNMNRKSITTARNSYSKKIDNIKSGNYSLQEKIENNQFTDLKKKLNSTSSKPTSISSISTNKVSSNYRYNI